MQINYDSLNRPQAPALTVCNPDNTSLAPVSVYDDFKPSLEFNATSTLGLKVYKNTGVNERKCFESKTKTESGNIINLRDAKTISGLIVDGKANQTVTVQGKNIFSTSSVNLYHGTALRYENGYYIAYEGDYGGIIFNSAKIKNGVTYTISFIYKSTDNVGWYTVSSPNVCLPAKYGSNKSLGLTIDGNEHTKSITFTATADEEISLSLLRSGSTGTVYYKNIQIEQGSAATTYEPFVSDSPSPPYPATITSTNKITANGTDYTIPDLYSIGDIKDSLNAITGARTQNIGKLALNGTENWVWSTNYAYLTVSGRTKTPDVLCSHFLYGTSYRGGSNEIVGSSVNTAIVIYPSIDIATDVATFKAYLAAQDSAGTPVTVLYQLATPVTSTVTPIAITPQLPLTSITTNTQTNLSCVYDYYNLTTIKNSEQDCYKYIKVHKQIHIEGIGYFIITKCTEHDSIDDGIYKDIECTSCEIEINNKGFNLSSGTYGFYITDDREKTILGKIMAQIPSWKIGNVDETIMSVNRTFDDIETQCYSFMMGDMKTAFGCICDFDIENRKVNIINADNEIESCEVFLSHDNVVENLEVNESADDIITALTVRGADGLTIRDVNPTGNEYIIKFGDFKDTDWMSQDLIDAIDIWENKIANNKTLYENLLLDLQNLNAQLETLNTDLITLNGDMTTLVNVKAKYAANSTEYSNVQTQINAKQVEINNKKSDITSKTTEITIKQSDLKSLASSLSMNNNFTVSQLQKLDHLIHAETYTSENFAIQDNMTYAQRQEQARQLYEDGVKTLNKLCRARAEFSIDCSSALFQKELLPTSQNLTLGKLIDVEVHENDIQKIMLLKYDIDWGNGDYIKDVSLTLGNRYRLHDSYVKYSDSASSVSKISSDINLSRHDWSYPVKSGLTNTVEDFMKSAIDATLNNIKSSSNSEEMILGTAGLIGKAKDEITGEYLPYQSWLTHGEFLMTDDGFQTAKVGIGRSTMPDGTIKMGVIAESLIGKMILGETLTLQNKSGSYIVDDDGFVIKNAAGTPAITIKPNDGIRLLDPNMVIQSSKLVSADNEDVYVKIGETTYDNSVVKCLTVHNKYQDNDMQIFKAYNYWDWVTVLEGIDPKMQLAYNYSLKAMILSNYSTDFMVGRNDIQAAITNTSGTNYFRFGLSQDESYISAGTGLQNKVLIDGINNKIKLNVNGTDQATCDASGFHAANGATADRYIPSGDGHSGYTMHFVNGIYTGVS